VDPIKRPNVLKLLSHPFIVGKEDHIKQLYLNLNMGESTQKLSSSKYKSKLHS